MLLVSPALQQEFSVTPKGYVLGYGNACDAYHPTAPDPEGKGLKKALSFALCEADVTPEELAFVNAHGTASPSNDSAEAAAFRAVLPNVPVWGSKGVTGHTLGAAGAVEAIVCLKVLETGMVPPTINLLEKDPKCDLNYVPNHAVQADIDLCLSNSLGFGGHNACLAFRKV